MPLLFSVQLCRYCIASKIQEVIKTSCSYCMPQLPLHIVILKDSNYSVIHSLQKRFGFRMEVWIGNVAFKTYYALLVKGIILSLLYFSAVINYWRNNLQNQEQYVLHSTWLCARCRWNGFHLKHPTQLHCNKMVTRYFATL